MKFFYNCGKSELSFAFDEEPKYDTAAVNALISGESISGSFTVLPGCTAIGSCDEYAVESKSVFTGCTGLTGIVLPDTVTVIGDNAFSGCTGLTSVNLPGHLETVGKSAFSRCSSLTEINLPDSLTSIGYYAFQNCTSLASITIPAGLTSLGSGVFEGCTALTGIQVSPDNPVYDSRNNCNALIRTSDNTMLKATANTFIPNSVTAIDGAFRDLGRTGILDLSGTNITGLSGYAFFNNNYTKIILPDKPGLTMNGEIFHGNKLCTEVVIHNNVSSIPSSCFRSMTSLPALTFPSSVRNIGFWCCYGDSALASVYILAPSMTRIDGSAFSNCPNLRNIYCRFAEGAVSGAPWGANNATVHYNYNPED